MTRCDCCDLPVESCGREAERRQAEEARAERDRLLMIPGVVAAAYPGKCATCGTWYPSDEPIRKTEDGWSSMLCCPEVTG